MSVYAKPGQTIAYLRVWPNACRRDARLRLYIHDIVRRLAKDTKRPALEAREVMWSTSPAGWADDDSLYLIGTLDL